MTDLDEVRDAILLIAKHPDCLEWKSFSDKGSDCCGPYTLNTEHEIREDAFALAAVKIVVTKGSALHLELARSIAQIIGCKYVTYDWMIKVLGRVIALGSYNEFCNTFKLSIEVRAGMIKRGLTRINSIAEAFA